MKNANLKLVQGPNDSQAGSLCAAVLEYPYYSWQSPETGDLFWQLVKLKLDAYLGAYPDGTLPMDTTDFLASHQCLFVKAEGEMKLAATYKAVSLSRCRHHLLEFPVLRAFEGAGALKHADALRAILAEQFPGRPLVYCGGFAISPEFRGNPEIKKAIWALHANYLLSEKAISVVAATVRFKVDREFLSIGYRGLCPDGEQTVALPQYFNELVKPLILEEVSAEGKALAESHQLLWDSRREVGPRPLSETPKKAA